MNRTWNSLAIATLLVAASVAAHAEEKLTYNMSWLPQGSSIGVAVAADQGWFKTDGLEVALIRGYGGNRTANELDQGQFEIGYVDPISLVLNRGNGGKIRLIGAINTQWPAGICFAPSRHAVKSLDDLRGLTMGGGSARGPDQPGAQPRQRWQDPPDRRDQHPMAGRNLLRTQPACGEVAG